MRSRSSLPAWRTAILASAFALLLAVPLLNKCQIDFVQGWYQSLSIGQLWFVSPLEGLESILVSKTLYPPLLVGLLVPVLVALLLGRVFCSWICPIQFLSLAGDWLKNRLLGKSSDRWQLPRWLLWASLLGEILLALLLGAPLFVFLSPPGLVGRELMTLVLFQTLAWEGLVIALVLVLNSATRRFYCRYFCPLGALLALLGSRRRLRVTLHPQSCSGCRSCDRACPLGLAVSCGQGGSIHCWNCGECVAGCGDAALNFSWAPQHRL